MQRRIAVSQRRRFTVCWPRRTREESPMLARLFTAADLSIAVGADVTSIDPHYHNLTPNNNIAEHIFETLVTKDPKSLLRPALAISWKAIDDLTWEFKL